MKPSHCCCHILCHEAQNGSSVPQRFSYIFRMHTKVSRYPTNRCSEMICQTASSPGMQRRRHAGSMSVSFFYRNKTLSRDALGAGAHLAVPVSYSHKRPGKFCSVHHIRRHRNCPGSDTTTKMDIPIQGFIRLFHLRCFAFKVSL